MELSLKDRIRRAELLGLLAVLGVGLALSWVVSSLIEGRTAAAAQSEARAVATALIATRLDAADVASPMTPRNDRIERALDHDLASKGILGIGVRRFDGTIVMAAGEVHSGVVLDPSSSLTRAFEGRVVSELVTDPSGRRLMASYVPLFLEGDGGNLDAVAEVYQDYEVIGASFEVLRKTVVPIVVIAFLLLYVLLRRSWRSALAPVVPNAIEEPTERAALRPIGSTAH